VIDFRNFVRKLSAINILQALTPYKLLILEILRDKIQI